MSELRKSAVKRIVNENKRDKKHNVNANYNNNIERRLQDEDPDLTDKAIKLLKDDEEKKNSQCQTFYGNFRNTLSGLRELGVRAQQNEMNFRAGSKDAFERALEDLRKENYD